MKNARSLTFETRKATSGEELRLIQQLRYDIYTCDVGMHVPGLDHNERILADDLDNSGIHWYASTGKDVVGAVRIHENLVPAGMESILELNSLPRPFCYCSRLCVHQEFRGAVVFRQLVNASFAEFERLRAVLAICHCYPHLERLYRRIGFHVYGKPFIPSGLDDLGWQRPLRVVLRPELVTQTA